MQRNIILALIILGSLGYWYYLVSEYEAGNEIKPYPALDFELKDQNEDVIKLSDFKGKVVLLHFWASWCPPCVDEIPSLNTLYNTLDKEKFVLLAISHDNTIKDVLDFKKKVPFDFKVYLDHDQKIADLYDTYRLPESYLINKQGMVVRKITGPQNWSSPIWKTEIYNLYQ